VAGVTAASVEDCTLPSAISSSFCYTDHLLLTRYNYRRSVSRKTLSDLERKLDQLATGEESKDNKSLQKERQKLVRSFVSLSHETTFVVCC